MKGLRVKAQAIPVATPMRSVRAARNAACVTELRNSSGAHVHSIPARSASFVSDSSSATEFPIAATEMRSRADMPLPGLRRRPARARRPG